MKRIKRLVPIILLSTHGLLSGQISFTDHTDALMAQPSYSGVAMSVTDMDGDGLDDIVRLGYGKNLVIEYQQADGTTFHSVEIGAVGNNSQWSMCVADVDNDGQNEVFSGEAYAPIEIMHSSLDFGSPVMTVLPEGANIFVQGANFADVNNDGLLDIFACHDDGASVIWGNQGDGTFIKQPTWIDFSINGSLGESASGNYGSLWTDIDSDGDIDLYIAKCRQGVTDPTDHRRINKLYINDGAGNFTEESEARGLASGWQSWTADVQDLNNDGAMDVFITNHDHAAQILLNDGNGYFTEVENTGVNVSGLAIQGVLRDFDNDGWIDILVAGNRAQLFRNNGDTTFTEIEGIFDNNNMESFALGDLNGDGYVDVYGGYAFIYTTPSDINDKIWINDGGDNNHLTVSLIGQVSNRNAIGARLELFGEWGKAVREVRSGESYGIMNSMTQYFGLGTSEQIDSLVIHWPSGLVQTEYQIAVNSRVQLIEGGCIAEAPAISIQGNTTFCPGDSLVLSVPDEYASYKWSDGQSTSSIVVYEEGNYSLTLETDEGCTGFSEVIRVTVDPQLASSISLVGSAVICEGESTSIQLDQDYTSGITWSSGDTTRQIEVTESGSYTATVEGLCSDFTSNTIDVIVEVRPDAPIAFGDLIMPGEVATLTAEGNNIAWYDEADAVDPVATGMTYSISGLEENTTFYAADRIGDPGEKAAVGMLDHSGSLYSGIPNTNLLIFDAMVAFRIDSVKVYTDMPGVRRVVVLNDNGDVLNAVDVDVPMGENQIYLGLAVPAGMDLSLSTDGEVNLMNFGGLGPRLQRSSSNVNYPYIVEDVVQIKGSNFGPDYYYYFYDWRINTGESRCEGDRTAVEVIIEEEIAVTDIYAQNGLLIFPNPAQDKVTIQVSEDLSFPITARIFNNIGQAVSALEITQSSSELDLSSWSPGAYRIHMSNADKQWRQTIIVSKQ